MKKVNLTDQLTEQKTYPSGIEGLEYPIGLTTIGSITGMGKTSFILNSALRLAEQGQPILFFEIETSANILQAKMLSNLSFMAGCPVPTDAILYGKELSPEQQCALGNAKEKLSIILKNLTIYIPDAHGISVADIREEIENFIAETGQKPVVFLDYLQVLTDDSPLDEKERTTQNVAALYQLAHQHEIPIIVISALNRENYETQKNIGAFRGSGMVEYASDLLMTMTFTEFLRPEREWQKNPRFVQVNILKNRTGKTGGAIPMRFYPEFAYFEYNTDE